MEDRISPSERLKRIRELVCLSQREIAKEFGVSAAAIAHWESGVRPIPGPVLRLIELYEQHVLESPENTDKQAEQLRAMTLSWARKLVQNERSSPANLRVVVTEAIQRYLSVALDKDLIRKRIQLALLSRIVDSVGEIKGVPMKIAQVASFLDVNMTPELRESLAQLQTMGSPMPANMVARCIHDEFGVHPRRLFAEWAPQPIAVASIGQVHRARLHTGEIVAVKVQHPGIRKKIQAAFDKLSIVQYLASLGKQGSRSLFDEIRTRVIDECDYEVEAANQTRFREVFAAEPRIVIPKVFTEFSRRTVLTTEFCDGQGYREFLAASSEAERNLAAETIARFHMSALMRHGLMHADPHPGNYVFLGNGRVAFVDFGRTVSYPQEKIASNRDLVVGVLTGDSSRTKNAMQRLDLVTDWTRFDFDEFYELLRRQDEHHLYDGRFQMTPEHVAKIDRLMRNYSGRKHLRITRDFFWFMFLNRSLLHLFADMRATSNWRRSGLEVLGLLPSFS